MPVYVYRCKCGKHEDLIRSIADRDKQAKCSACGKRMKREVFTGQKTHRDYLKPVLSDAMGVHPSQVAEHRRLFPDIPMTNDGRVIVTSHTEHRRIMKRLGFIDRAGYF